MKELIARARKAREHAFAPLTDFKVGAALEAEDGTIYTGCNIESPSAIMTLCAERAALVHALSQGARKFKRIAVVAKYQEPCPPCGFCRQALIEFAPDIEIIMANTEGQTKVSTIKELVPGYYDASKW